jgi:UDP-N-acetylglucosamine 2-epimerase
VRVLTCVGARPQFVKASVLSRELARRGIEEILVHTGQHYDPAMSDVFFEELELPKPRYQLGVGSAGPGVQTGEMMRRLEPVVLAEAPDWTIVYGDTNSTLAGALVASKLHVRVAHVEAGLRSFDRRMPEEINRIVADHIADALFVPNERAAAQLASEGIVHGVHVAGDLMIDLVCAFARSIPERPAILERYGLTPRTYAVATIHRAANTDDPATFARLVEGLHRVDMPIVFPVHPRTRRLAEANSIGRDDNIIPSGPLPYRETMELLSRAACLFTDSGGMQKEAFALRVPCVTLRNETEWIETLEDGWNVLTGSDPDKIERAAHRFMPARQQPHYGDGNAARRIVDGLYDGVETARKRPSEVAGFENGVRIDDQLHFAGHEPPVRAS